MDVANASVITSHVEICTYVPGEEPLLGKSLEEEKSVISKVAAMALSDPTARMKSTTRAHCRNPLISPQAHSPWQPLPNSHRVCRVLCTRHFRLVVFYQCQRLRLSSLRRTMWHTVRPEVRSVQECRPLTYSWRIGERAEGRNVCEGSQISVSAECG